MRIYLIGFMGSGKSAAGRALARHLAVPFVDLDERIEREEGRSVAEIFTTRGEVAFRSAERRVLEAVSSGPEAVVATGGGTPCFSGNMDLMNRTGTTVYLEVPAPVLLERLSAETERRPKLRGDGPLAVRIAELLRQRLPVYERAQLVVPGDGTGPEAVAARIERLLREAR